MKEAAAISDYLCFNKKASRRDFTQILGKEKDLVV
jgi:hypothetical protein